MLRSKFPVLRDRSSDPPQDEVVVRQGAIRDAESQLLPTAVIPNLIGDDEEVPG